MHSLALLRTLFSDTPHHITYLIRSYIVCVVSFHGFASSIPPAWRWLGDRDYGIVRSFAELLLDMVMSSSTSLGSVRDTLAVQWISMSNRQYLVYVGRLNPGLILIREFLAYWFHSSVLYVLYILDT